MKRSTKAALIMALLLVPVTLLLGTKLPGRWYYLTSTLIIIELMAPFFLMFEGRRPRARELVIIAVMCALAAVSRVVFAFMPSFKPITAIIMLTGIAFGPEAGFLTGAVSAFASNFFYSQGAWTPWQMMAYGVGGFLAGLVFFRKRQWIRSWVLAVFGFVAIVLLVGPILDCSTLFTALTVFTPDAVALVFLRGVPANVIHGVSCALTMIAFGPALLAKLERVKRKYGMLDQM